MQLQLVALVAATSMFVGAAAQGTCTNTDFQVVVYRYPSANCGGEETVAYYQSGSAIREALSTGTAKYKQYTCCDDGSMVTYYDSSTNTYTDLADDQCLTGTAAETGQSYTDEVSFMFDCVKNPSQAAITLTVYPKGATECSSSETPMYRIPVYEGCNEDFPFLMDLECDGEAVNVAWTDLRSNECADMSWNDNGQSFTLQPGCNLGDPDNMFFGLFTEPIFVTTTCSGASGGTIAAVVIIILILLGAGGFAWYWFKIRPNKQVDSSFTEYNEYSQLDESHNDLL